MASARLAHPQPAARADLRLVRAAPALRLRIARARDRAAIRAFLGRLSPSTLQYRYLTMLSTMDGPLADRELQRILDRDLAQHVVVVAEDATEIRGIAEFVIDADSRAAELALTIEDAFQHRGIGRRLYRRLEALARRRGVLRFIGDMRHGNYAMREFLRATGRPLHLESTSGEVRFTLRIA